MPSVTMLGLGVLAVLWIVLTGTVRSSMHARLDFLTSVPVDLRVSFSKGTKLPLVEVVLCFQFAELALASLVYCCCAAGAAGDVGPVEVLEHEPLH